MPTIETCYNVFGDLSSDAKNHIKTIKRPARIKKLMQIFLSTRPAPPPGDPPVRKGVSKMARVPEGEICLPTTPTLWVKNFILY